MTEGGGAEAAGTGAAGGAPTTGVAKEAAGRVLTLAVESLDMLQGVAQVFGESLERAERFVSFFVPSSLRPFCPFVPLSLSCFD